MRRPARGGAREGAGRPRLSNAERRQTLTIRLPGRILAALPADRSEFIEQAVREKLIREGIEL